MLFLQSLSKYFFFSKIGLIDYFIFLDGIERSYSIECFLFFDRVFLLVSKNYILSYVESYPQ
jgi:hypothetical protein